MIEFSIAEYQTPQQNIITNGGFEDGLINWHTWKDVSLETTDVAHGAQSMRLNGNATANHWVKVQPNTSYTLSAMAKLDDPAERVVMGVANHGFVEIYDTEYTLQQLIFTTSDKEDSVKINFWRPSAGVGYAYLDELYLAETAYAYNNDFEKGLLGWSTWNSVALDTATPATGAYSMMLQGNSSANQWISTKKNTTYSISFDAKVDDSSVPVTFGVKDHNNKTIVKQELADTNYTSYSVTFTADTTSAKLFFWLPKNAIGNAYLDNIRITEAGSLKNGRPSQRIIEAEKQATLIWPNPADDRVNISLSSFSGSTTVAIYTQIGRCVYQTETDANNLSHLTVSTGELTPGIYLVTIFDAASTKRVEKLLVK